MSAFLALLKLVPLKVWLIMAAMVALQIGILFWNHHERAIAHAQDQAIIDKLNASARDAQDANKASSDAITSLKFAMAQCESGRLADQTAQLTAMRDRDAAEQKLTQSAAAARAKLKALLAGACKAWAEQPACGATP
jgi:zona occludens toxin (predicted ATPase)